jgi:prolyl 4-hydroxylase
MMTKSALATLPPAWQVWINDNLARGCEPRSMAEVMVRDGRFDEQLARAVIEEARRRAGRPLLTPRPMPEIGSGANIIHTPDREVKVLLSMKSPRVVLLGDVLSDEECNALVEYGRARLEPSPVISENDEKVRLHEHRSSRGAMLQRGESELVARIEARIAALTAWPVERGEGLQVLQYEKGNEYRPHFDWFDPSLPGPRKHLERGGQRVATMIMYLSDVEQGGGTSFPEIGLQVQPKKGCAVFFGNTDANGMPDRRTLHAGEPVESGTKVIATKWLREREYR